MVETEPVDPESLAPELWPLLEMWRSECRLKGRLLRPGEIVPNIRGRWLRLVALIAPGARAGFVIETCGFDLIRRFGRLAGGHRVASLAPGIRQGLGRKLRLAARTRGPVVWRPAVLLGRDPIYFSELILPLSEDGETICQLLLIAREERRPRRIAPPPPEMYEPDWEHD
ncbi:MAG TPA: hypothetical protein VII56_02190 [Rhizomicrobium sp.]